MEAETLKLLGSGGSQFILAAGYAPVFWLIKILWVDRAALQEKLLAMLALQFEDAAKRKELWDAQSKVIDGQTSSIRDQAKVIDGQTNSIHDLVREVQATRAELQRMRP